MRFTTEKITQEIDSLISAGIELLKTKWSPADHGIISFNTYVETSKYKAWRTKVLSFLECFLPNNSKYIQQIEALDDPHLTSAETIVELLTNLKEQIEQDIITIQENTPLDSSGVLLLLFARFHKVARQLRNRYSNRSTLEIEDEYDVQDLLHSLLQLYFDDVRKEEWTPSYAGGCSRQDFLLKSENIVIETKKTRAGLKDKELGEQLLIDIARYKSHPDCKRLVCFVYDPEGRLGNPNGLMSDLNNTYKDFVQVIIQPV